MLVKDPSSSMPKLLLKLMAATSAPEPASQSVSRNGMLYTHIARLEHILQQVQKDGFHVEYIQSLGWQAATAEDIIAAVDRWAGQANLKVSINQVQGIFFFEQG